ncbi:MAG TPA: YbaB/EbfC family nucleoid-associated protein [Anaerolineales bacterium]|nr:YbaB/EbfC family nucleoid-associated protein [Anaerolineales bacterium]
MNEGEGGGGILGMAAQLKRMQAQLKEAQAALAEETIESRAGGGAVRVVMSGTQECREVKIAPELLREGQSEKLQELVRLAVNQAIRDSQSLAARRLGPLAKGLTGMIPGA